MLGLVSHCPGYLDMPKHMRPAQAAEYVQLSEGFLAKMRLRGDGPIFIKAGPRVVLYDQDDLDCWLSERRRRSTSDNPGS
jgi:hypothetical protein